MVSDRAVAYRRPEKSKESPPALTFSCRAAKGERTQPAPCRSTAAKLFIVSAVSGKEYYLVITLSDLLKLLSPVFPVQVFFKFTLAVLSAAGKRHHRKYSRIFCA